MRISTIFSGKDSKQALTAGNDCYGIGAVSGSGLGPEEITNCTAENVRIAVGDNAYLMGGIAGYAGGYEDEARNVSVTDIARCTAKNVEIKTGENIGNTGGIIGGRFRFVEDDVPTVFTIADCTASTTTQRRGSPAGRRDAGVSTNGSYTL